MTGVQYYESGQVPVTQNLQLTTHVPSSANRQTGHCPLAHSLLETATRGHMYPHNSPFPGSSSPDSSPTHVSPRSLPHSHSALNHTHKQGTTPTQLLAAATPRKCVSSGVKGREARRGDPECAQVSDPGLGVSSPCTGHLCCVCGRCSVPLCHVESGL